MIENSFMKRQIFKVLLLLFFAAPNFTSARVNSVLFDIATYEVDKGKEDKSRVYFFSGSCREPQKKDGKVIIDARCSITRIEIVCGKFDEDEAYIRSVKSYDDLVKVDEVDVKSGVASFKVDTIKPLTCHVQTSNSDASKQKFSCKTMNRASDGMIEYKAFKKTVRLVDWCENSKVGLRLRGLDLLF